MMNAPLPVELVSTDGTFLDRLFALSLVLERLRPDGAPSAGMPQDLLAALKEAALLSRNEHAAAKTAQAELKAERLAQAEALRIAKDEHDGQMRERRDAAGRELAVEREAQQAAHAAREQAVSGREAAADRREQGLNDREAKLNRRHAAIQAAMTA